MGTKHPEAPGLPPACFFPFPLLPSPSSRPFSLPSYQLPKNTLQACELCHQPDACNTPWVPLLLLLQNDACNRAYFRKCSLEVSGFFEVLCPCPTRRRGSGWPAVRMSPLPLFPTCTAHHVLMTPSRMLFFFTILFL